MKYILSPDQMRECDSFAINEFEIHSSLLMENAARSAFEFISKILIDNKLVKKTLIICGSGNNGGDGFALARHLVNITDTTVYWIGDADKMSAETLANFKTLQKMSVLLVHISDDRIINDITFDFDCIIDSMIGVGGSENIKGITAEILKKISLKNCLKIAIDAPTGLNTLTGETFKYCFHADYTITMYSIKTGMLLNEGQNFCGKILIAGLGIPGSMIKQFSKIFALEIEDVRKIFPRRKKISSKFDYGRLTIVAGSNKYPGAGVLSANAAIKSGAGLVDLFTTMLHPSILPEVIPHIVTQSDSGAISPKALDGIIKTASKSNAVLIGPGLSDNEDTLEMAESLIDALDSSIPIIIDADGLRIIESGLKLDKNVILTPHIGEFSRLTGIDRHEIERNTLDYAIKFAKEFECNILLKHIPTIITNGTETFLNLKGNPGMATGGSGDVLSGIIGSFISQGLDTFVAGYLGAFMHSRAGDFFAEHYSMNSLTASGLIESLNYIFSEFESIN